MSVFALIPAAVRRWAAAALGIAALVTVTLAQARTIATLRAERRGAGGRIDTMKEARNVRKSIEAASRDDRDARLARWMREP